MITNLPSRALGAAAPPGLPTERPAPAELPQPADHYASEPAHPGLLKWGLAGMAALAAGTALSVPATPPVEHALIDFDDFTAPDEPDVNTHGQLTAMILEGRLNNAPASGRHVERMSVPIGYISMEPMQQGQAGSFNRYVEQRFMIPIDGTAAALDRAAGLGERAVISQSQGASDSRIVESLWSQAQWDKPFVKSIAEQLHVEHPEDQRELLQAIVDGVHAVHAGSAAIREGHAKVVEAGERADRAGVIRVVSAGNQGELEKTLDKLGVKVDPDFYRSELIDSHAISVGASDNHGTPNDVADDRPADLASPHADAVVAANGVKAQLWAKGRHEEPSGSSWAAPQVALYVDHFLYGHPQASRDDVVHYLQGIAHPIPGAETYVGAGVLPEPS